MDCEYYQGRCPTCNRPIDSPQIRRTCITPTHGPPQPPRQLLGDRVEHALRSVGITEDRWLEAREALGGWPKSKGCGCNARKQFLNRAHEWWLRNMPR